MTFISHSRIEMLSLGQADQIDVQRGNRNEKRKKNAEILTTLAAMTTTILLHTDR